MRTSAEEFAASVRGEDVGFSTTFTQERRLKTAEGISHKGDSLRPILGLVASDRTETPQVPGGQGAQGPQGHQGFQGFQGAQGDRGDPGSDGSQGSQGNQGFQGGQGDQGPQGPQGDQGSQGNQGFQGFQGDPGNAGGFHTDARLGFDPIGQTLTIAANGGGPTAVSNILFTDGVLISFL